MIEQIKKKQIEELNEVFLNPNLSIEELEEKIELVSPAWCLSVCSEVCPVCEVCAPMLL